MFADGSVAVTGKQGLAGVLTGVALELADGDEYCCSAQRQQPVYVAQRAATEVRIEWAVNDDEYTREGQRIRSPECAVVQLVPGE